MKDTFRNGEKWSYVGQIYGRGRKFGYYVAAGKGTNNWYNKSKNFKKKSDALKYAKSIIK